jgi:hypothetical protein
MATATDTRFWQCVWGMEDKGESREAALKACEKIAGVSCESTGKEPMKPDKRQREVLEFVQASNSHKVDREAGIIRGVKVLGHISKNGHSYTSEAIQKGRDLYEGVAVFVDHPVAARVDDERKLAEQFGWLESVRVEPDGLHADLHFVKAHPMASIACELAERRPDKMGLSHNAVVTESRRDGKIVFENIHRVRSVDLVCRPATTRGIFEQELAMSPEEEAAAQAAEAAKKAEEEEAAAAAQAAANANVATESEKAKATYEHALDVLEAAGIPPGKTNIGLLVALAGDDARQKALVETWKPVKAGGVKPKSIPKDALEGQQGAQKGDNEKFEAAYQQMYGR